MDHIAASPIDKPARTPTGRIPLMAFVADAECESLLRNCLSELGVPSPVLTRGGIGKAVQHLAKERSPHILIVDITGVALPVSEVNNLAEVCEPGVTVIAIGTRNDVALYRDLLRAGVADYIVKPLTLQLIAKALRSATSAGEATPISQKLGKLVAFAGARGGVGTTTIAVNLAWHLANRQNRRVALVDLDLQSGDCGMMLNLKSTGGLREALESPLRVDSVFLERAMAMHGERLFVLSAEEPLSEEVRFGADAVEGVLNVLRQQFHYVLVDLPRIAAPPYRRTLERADLRVVIADQTLRSARDTVRLSPLIDIGAHRNLLVINRAGEGGRSEVTLKEMSETVALQPKCVIPYQPKLFAAVAAHGQVAAAQSSRIAEPIAALAAEITGRASRKRPWWRRRR